MSSSELKEKIKAEIKKSGFPLEIFCKRSLLDSNWMLSTDKYFITPEGDYKEIDALAAIETSNKKKAVKLPISIMSQLIVECKKK